MSGQHIVGFRIQCVGVPERIIDIRIAVASSFVARLVGLLAHKKLETNSGLLLVPCGSIHTVGMRFPIDVVFLDHAGRVLGWADSVPPNRFRFAPKGTRQVLEIAQGNRIRTGINLADYLIFG